MDFFHDGSVVDRPSWKRIQSIVFLLQLGNQFDYTEPAKRKTKHKFDKTYFEFASALIDWRKTNERELSCSLPRRVSNKGVPGTSERKILKHMGNGIRFNKHQHSIYLQHNFAILTARCAMSPAVIGEDDQIVGH